MLEGALERRASVVPGSVLTQKFVCTDRAGGRSWQGAPTTRPGQVSEEAQRSQGRSDVRDVYANFWARTLSSAAMTHVPEPLRDRLEAGQLNVQGLAERVRSGRIRVPSFQRALKWRKEHVRELFDSLYRGYPIGSFLFWRRAAEAGTIELGPLRLSTAELHDAWWVVDGQQRITSLAAALLRPLQAVEQADDDFVVHFDPRTERFHAGGPAQATGEVAGGDRWVPCAVLLDAVELGEWLHDRATDFDADLRRVVFEAGRRIREYEIPYYVVAGDDESVVREIFTRINRSGVELEWTDVYDALFGHTAEQPGTLGELATDLEALSMGRLDETELLQIHTAAAGLDPTENLGGHLRDRREQVPQGLAEMAPAMRATLDFLRRHARIPHRRLLPYRFPLLVLARFFKLHESPGDRSLELLRRWVWRGLRTRAHRDDRTLLRKSVGAVGVDEEASVQRLLALTPRTFERPFTLAERFDARTADNRVAMLAAAAWGPRDLETGEPLDLGRLLSAEAAAAFCKLLPAAHAGAANRLLHRPLPTLREVALRRMADGGFDDPALASHGISEAAARALAAGDVDRFLSARAEALIEQVESVCRRFGQPGQNDRPSLAYVLRGQSA